MQGVGAGRPAPRGARESKWAKSESPGPTPGWAFGATPGPQPARNPGHLDTEVTPAWPQLPGTDGRQAPLGVTRRSLTSTPQRAEAQLHAHIPGDSNVKIPKDVFEKVFMWLIT